MFLRDLDDPSVADIFVGEHREKVNVAAPSSNGEWIASGDAAGRVLIWGQGNKMIKTDTAVNKCVTDIAWDAENKRLVAAGNGSEKMAHAFAWDTGSALGSVSGHTKTILSCDYKKTRPYRIVCGGEDFIATHHEGPPFKPSTTHPRLTDHTNYVNKIRFSPDGEQFVSVGSDMAINVYDAKTADHIKKIDAKSEGAHKGAIYSFAWSPDSKKIITASADKSCKLWDIESGAVEQTFVMGTTANDMQMSVVWSTKNHIVSTSLSGAMNYLDPENPATPKRVVHGHNAVATALAVDQANKVFYSADSSGVICAWKDFTAQWFTGKGHASSINGLALNSDGSKLVSIGLTKMFVNECKDNSYGESVDLGDHASCVTCGAATPTLTAVGVNGNKVIVLNGGDRKELDVGSKPTNLAFNHDDSLLAVGTHKGVVTVFAMPAGTVAYELKEHDKPVVKVEWSKNGQYLTTSSQDKRLLVWEGEKGPLNPTEWAFHGGMITDHSMSPDGLRVASVAQGLELIVYKDTTKWGSARDKVENAHKDAIHACGWLDNEHVLTLGGDACIKVWKM